AVGGSHRLGRSAPYRHIPLTPQLRQHRYDVVNQPDTLTTPRLRMRDWLPGDHGLFAELNADAETMRHFPATLNRDDSDALATRFSEQLRERGWGLWALEVIQTGEFIGFTGLSV